MQGEKGEETQFLQTEHQANTKNKQTKSFARRAKQSVKCCEGRKHGKSGGMNSTYLS
jgi:hypothetical protein